MEFLDLEGHDPEEFIGKHIAIAGATYEIVMQLGGGVEKLVYLLRNIASQRTPLVLKIHRTEGEGRLLWDRTRLLAFEIKASKARGHSKDAFHMLEAMVVPDCDHRMHVQRNAGRIEFYPSATGEVWSQVQVRLAAEDYGATIAALKDLLAIHGQDTEALVLLSRLYAHAGEDTFSAVIAQEVVNIEPNVMEYLEYAFESCVHAELWADAERIYRLLESKYDAYHSMDLVALFMYMAAGLPEHAATVRYGKLIDWGDSSSGDFDEALRDALQRKAAATALLDNVQEAIEGSEGEANYPAALTLTTAALSMYPEDLRGQLIHWLLKVAVGRFEEAYEPLAGLGRRLSQLTQPIAFVGAAYAAVAVGRFTEALKNLQLGISSELARIGVDDLPLESAPRLAYYVGVAGTPRYHGIDFCVRMIERAVQEFEGDDRQSWEALAGDYRDALRIMQDEVDAMHSQDGDLGQASSHAQDG